MKRVFHQTLASVICVAWLLLFAPSAVAGRTAAEILREYDGLIMPKFDPEFRNDAKKMKAFREEQSRIARRHGELAMELFAVEPDNERLADLMIARWVEPMMDPKTALGIAAEIDRASPRFKNPDKVKTARHMRAIAIIRGNPDRLEIGEAEIDRFLHDYPKDNAGASLLYGFATQIEEPGQRVKMLRRLIAEFPDSPAAKGAKGALEVLEKVGKPFELAFDDAVTGKRVSIAGLKGKVVVIDCWATWCGPCVAEMPKMKSLYAEFNDKGVEFIGVSLDSSKEEGGLAKLREFVSKNDIAWPQHHDGLAWDGPLVERLGITAIPAIFLIDTNGKLAEVRARGQLETLLPRYLAKGRGVVAH